MTITEHKALTAAIPEDLVEGEEIEVSRDGCEWRRCEFSHFETGGLRVRLLDTDPSWMMYVLPYARRPAAAQKKRLKDDPWIGGVVFRFVDSNGCAHMIDKEKYHWEFGGDYDSTNWQNSLERRPTAHQQHMADLDKGIKAVEAGIKRSLGQRRQKPLNGGCQECKNLGTLCRECDIDGRKFEHIRYSTPGILDF